jgi:putative glutamine amidotransferase
MHPVTRPLILVNCWRRGLPTFLGEQTRLDTLDPAYAERVSDAGGQPLLLSRPPSACAESAQALVAIADGVLLTGGGDVDPAVYGDARENVEADDADADAFELAIIKAARALELPTLAICRGAQLLAIAHGGRLSQRLPAVAGHTQLFELSPEAILAQRHPVTLAKGSRIAHALGGRETVPVNTIHHHQIADPGQLEVTATAPGDVIEAVEPRSGWACVGVQWHPEKMEEPEQRKLFEQLVRDARVGRDARAGRDAPRDGRDGRVGRRSAAA